MKKNDKVFIGFCCIALLITAFLAMTETPIQKASIVKENIVIGDIIYYEYIYR